MKSQSVTDWAAAEVAALTPTPAPAGISEEQIAAKVAAGLSRDQAIEVLVRDKTTPGPGSAGAPPATPGASPGARKPKSAKPPKSPKSKPTKPEAPKPEAPKAD